MQLQFPALLRYVSASSYYVGHCSVIKRKKYTEN